MLMIVYISLFSIVKVVPLITNYSGHTLGF